MSLAQLVMTIHNICKVYGLIPGQKKEKKTNQLNRGSMVNNIKNRWSWIKFKIKVFIYDHY